MLRALHKYITTDTPRFILIVGSLLSVMLLLSRVFMSLHLQYTFLIWNLFLAWIPFLLSDVLIKMAKNKSRKLAIGLIFCLWLLFLPNAPYILTDLFHLKPRQNVPLWFDLLLILAFAWNGLMLFYFSVFTVHRFLEKSYTSNTAWLLTILIFILCSYGIYMGRFERWNSWDILSNPIELAASITRKVFHPWKYPQAVGVTISYSAFLIISYLTLFFLIRSKRHE